MAEVVVYLPVAVSIETETGELIKEPEVDFSGAPWVFVNEEENIWQPDREDVGEYSWGRDKVREDMAIEAAERLFENWLGNART